MLLALLFTIPNSGCSQELVWSEVLDGIREEFPDVPQMSTHSLAALLASSSQTQPVLIDTREKEEYAVSHLPGAIQLDPDTETFTVLNAVAKDTPIVVYCSVGYRSSKMAGRLMAAGFTNVSNLEGSIFNWANEGLPVVRNDVPVKAVHPYNKVWGMLLDKELRQYTPKQNP